MRGVEFCPEMSCPGSVRNILSGNVLSGECPEYSVRKCSVRGVSGIFCPELSCPGSVRVQNVRICPDSSIDRGHQDNTDPIDL